MANDKEYIKLELDRIAELRVSWAATHELQAQSRSPEYFVRAQKESVIRQLALELAKYIQWSEARYDEYANATITTGLVRVIKPWTSADAAPTSDKSS